MVERITYLVDKKPVSEKEFYKKLYDECIALTLTEYDGYFDNWYGPVIKIDNVHYRPSYIVKQLNPERWDNLLKQYQDYLFDRNKEQLNFISCGKAKLNDIEFEIERKEVKDPSTSESIKKSASRVRLRKLKESLGLKQRRKTL